MCPQDHLLKFKLSIKIGKKGDLSDFECGIVLGARFAGLSISETADTVIFTHNHDPKKTKYPVNGRTLLVPEVREEWPDWFELMSLQYTGLNLT